MNDAELAKRIADIALLKGDFTLRSGRKSHYYLDKYLFSTQPDILAALGRKFAKRLPDDVDLLAGAELGGIPLVTTASLASGRPCVFVRNQKKTYGTNKQLEGKVMAGAKVALLEDVCTTGGQIIEAAKVLEEAGATISVIISTIDRQEGARENIESHGYRYETLFTKADLGV